MEKKRVMGIIVLLYSIFFAGIINFLIFMMFLIGASTWTNILLNNLLFLPMLLGSLSGLIFSFSGGIGLMLDKKWSKGISLSGMWILLVLSLYYFIFSIWAGYSKPDMITVITWVIIISEVLFAIYLIKKIKKSVVI